MTRHALKTDSASSISPVGPVTPVRVMLIGLGKLGLTVAEGINAHPGLQVVAAVDLDPAKLGRDLGELSEGRQSGVEVSDRVEPEWDVDVAVLMTSSRMSSVLGPVSELLAMGCNVVTSAEELAYPWYEFPKESRQLDSIAREHGVSILSAGANPGFVMDLVPVVLTTAIQRVQRIRVSRTMDVSPHRAERLKRFGLGKTQDEFAQVPRDVAHGHIGFRQSVDAIGDALGMEIDQVAERPLTPAVVADEVRSGECVEIHPNQVAVVRQSAVGLIEDRPVVSLEEHFGFLNPHDDIPRGDSLLIDGIDQQFNVSVSPGIRSFATTPAVILNLLGPVADARPGLLNTLEFAPTLLASKGLRTSTPRY